MPDGSEYVTMAQAQEILGVSGRTMWKLVKDGRLQAYTSAIDKRRKMIRRSDLDELTELRPIEPVDKRED